MFYDECILITSYLREENMNSLKFKSLKKYLLAFIAISATSKTYAAGALITFAGPSAIPTLSTTMLIVLSLLLFTVAFKISKQKNSTMGKTFVTILGASAILAMGSGVKMITEADAGGGPPITALTSTNNPPVRIEQCTGIDFANDAGIDITIASIVVDPGSVCNFPLFEADGDECVPEAIRTAENISFTGTLTNVIIPAGTLCAIQCYNTTTCTIDGEGDDMDAAAKGVKRRTRN